MDYARHVSSSWRERINQVPLNLRLDVIVGVKTLDGVRKLIKKSTETRIKFERETAWRLKQVAVWCHGFEFFQVCWYHQMICGTQRTEVETPPLTIWNGLYFGKWYHVKVRCLHVGSLGPSHPRMNAKSPNLSFICSRVVHIYSFLTYFCWSIYWTVYIFYRVWVFSSSLCLISKVVYDF